MTLKPDNFYADISSNNQSFNASQYRSAGHRVISIKATEGRSYTNPQYANWVHTAHQHGLAVIHYMYQLPHAGFAQEQADHFHNTIKDHFVRPGDYVMVDVEEDAPNEAALFCREVVTRLNEHGYKDPWAYCPLSYYTEGPLEIPSKSFVIAAWGEHKPVLRRGDTMKAWQYDNGTLFGPAGYPKGFAGIPGRVDANVLDYDMVKKFRARK